MKPSANRIENEINQWQAKEQRFEKLFSAAVVKGREFQKDKLAFYDQLQERYGKSPYADERETLRVAIQEKRWLEKQLYPSLLLRLMRRMILMAVKPAIRNIQARQMSDNQGQVQQQLSDIGFKNTDTRLKQLMGQGKDSFSMPVSWYTCEKERMDFELSFRKQQDGGYKLENYKAALTDTDRPDQKREHQFNIKDTGTVTASQAGNLLAGRSIQREGKWQQLDFNDKDASGNFRMKEFHQGYGFDLTTALQKLNLKDLRNGSTKEQLLERLANGEKVEVTLKMDGKEYKINIEANPQFKTMNIYDESGQKFRNPSGLDKEVRVEQKLTNEVKQNLNVSRKNGMSVG